MNIVHKINKRVIIVSFLSLAILILVCASLLYLKGRNSSDGTQQTVTLCVDDSIGSRIAEDRTMLRLEAEDKLTPIAEEIKQKEGHEKHAACLYPILVNAIQKDQTANARQYYDLINVAYIEEGSYGAAVGLDAWPPEHFKTMVEGMEQRAEVVNFDLYNEPDYYPTDEELEEMGSASGQ